MKKKRKKKKKSLPPLTAQMAPHGKKASYSWQGLRVTAVTRDTWCRIRALAICKTDLWHDQQFQLWEGLESGGCEFGSSLITSLNG